MVPRGLRWWRRERSRSSLKYTEVVKQDIKQVVTQSPGVKQLVTQKLGLVEQEVNQMGPQKPGVAPRDLQEEDNETGTSFRAMCLLPQVYTVTCIHKIMFSR